MSGTGTAFTESDSEISKIQELMYELRVAEIMTRPVVSVTSASSMAEAKEVMRSRRVSGLPVMDAERLVGIVSVEDVIRWLEQGPRIALVADWMTPRVLSVHANEPAIQAINKFRTYHIGRLPVLDEDDRLAGIVTPGDIVDRVVRVLDALYEEAAPRSRSERPVLEELASEHTTITLRYSVSPLDFDRTGLAATRIKRLLEALKVDPRVVRRAGIAAYEAEMNLTIHSTNGGKMVASIDPDWIEIEAIDDGPGIADVDQALEPGYSTAPDWIRELGFGAGMGLNNIRGCAEKLVIHSKTGSGTRLLMRFDLAGDERSTLRL